MFVLGVKTKRRRVIGGGIIDWIPKIASAFGRVGNFILKNKDTITNVANVAGHVAKAGATGASAVRQIIDALKARLAAAAAIPAEKPAGPSISLEKALSEKSIEFLKQLAANQHVKRAQPSSDINGRIPGSGFKTLNRSGQGLFWGKN